MNLLFVTDVFPYPPHHGSSVISYHWIRCLSSKHHVTLLSLELPSIENATGIRAELMIEVLSFSHKFSNRGSGLIKWVLSPMPRSIARVASEKLRRYLARTIEDRQIDVIIMVGPSLAALLADNTRRVPTLFVPYDSVALNLQSRLSFVKNPMRRAGYYLEYKKWQYVEAQLYTRADACVAVTDRDAEFITRHWSQIKKRCMYVVPNGVDTTYFSPLKICQRPNHLVTTGNLWSIESVVSLDWFLTDVFLQVKHAIPEVTMNIVGRSPDPTLYAKAASLEGVQVIGSVPDLRPYIAEAAVYVSPLILGSGIKNRVLEAMAMGKAIVATPQSCQGLKTLHDRTPLLVANRSEFANSVIHLLKNREVRRSLEISARQLVVQKHSWEATIEQVEKILQRLTEKLN